MGSLQAQKRADIANYPRLKHSLGMGAGFTTGYGLSYRYTPSEWGFQVNFAPYKVSDSGNPQLIEQYSFGVSFLYELVRLKSASLYFYEGNHFLYRRERISNPDPLATYIISSERKLNNGLGFGVSALASENVSFELMAGYATYMSFKEKNSPSLEINLTVEGAIYYKF